MMVMVIIEYLLCATYIVLGALSTFFNHKNASEEDAVFILTMFLAGKPAFSEAKERD